MSILSGRLSFLAREIVVGRAVRQLWAGPLTLHMEVPSARSALINVHVRIKHSVGSLT